MNYVLTNFNLAFGSLKMFAMLPNTLEPNFGPNQGLLGPSWASYIRICLKLDFMPQNWARPINMIITL